jgi:hypothetical protein
MKTAMATEDLRKIELSFAYKRASGVIESSCVPQLVTEEFVEWWDLESAEENISGEIAYLESRRLIERHPEHPTWVRICDEDEPLPDLNAELKVAPVLSTDCKLNDHEACRGQESALWPDGTFSMRKCSCPCHGPFRDPPSIKCPRCHTVSFHREDVRNGYCAKCHDYTSAPHNQPKEKDDAK